MDLKREENNIIGVSYYWDSPVVKINKNKMKVVNVEPLSKDDAWHFKTTDKNNILSEQEE